MLVRKYRLIYRCDWRDSQSGSSTDRRPTRLGPLALTGPNFSVLGKSAAAVRGRLPALPGDWTRAFAMGGANGGCRGGSFLSGGRTWRPAPGDRLRPPR